MRKATVSVIAFQICSFSVAPDRYNIKVIIILLDLFVNRFEPTIFSQYRYS